MQVEGRSGIISRMMQLKREEGKQLYFAVIKLELLSLEKANVIFEKTMVAFGDLFWDLKFELPVVK